MESYVQLLQEAGQAPSGPVEITFYSNLQNL